MVKSSWEKLYVTASVGVGRFRKVKAWSPTSLPILCLAPCMLPYSWGYLWFSEQLLDCRTEFCTSSLTQTHGSNKLGILHALSYKKLWFGCCDTWRKYPQLWHPLSCHPDSRAGCSYVSGILHLGMERGGSCANNALTCYAGPQTSASVQEDIRE